MMANFSKASIGQFSKALAPGGSGRVLCFGAAGVEIAQNTRSGHGPQVILICPDLTAADSFQSRRDITVHVAWVAEDAEGTACYRRYNLSHFASSRSPTGLQALYPGLRQAQTVDVEVKRLDALISPLDFPLGEDHLLVLDAGGEEMQILDQLLIGGLVHRFSEVLVTLPKFSLFEGAPDGRRLRERLEEQGFRLEQQDTSDPDLPVALMRLDRNWLKLMQEQEQIARQLEEAKVAAAAAELALAERGAEIEVLHREKVQLKKDRDAASQAMKGLKEELDRRTNMTSQRRMDRIETELRRLEAQLGILRKLPSFEGSQ